MRPFTQKMAYLFKAFSDNQPPQQVERETEKERKKERERKE